MSYATSPPPPSDPAPGAPPPNDTGPLVRVIVTAAVLVVLTAVALIFSLFRATDSRFGEAAVTATEDHGPENAPTAPPPVLAIAARASSEPAPPVTPDATPQWIWRSGEPGAGQRAYFRYVMSTDPPPRRAVLRLSCDNEAVVLVGDEPVGETQDWQRPLTIDLTPHLHGPADVITVRARNESGPAGLVAVIDVEMPGGSRRRIVTDATWTVADDELFSAPAQAAVLGPHGVAPWGEISGLLGDDLDRHLTAPPGFDVELVYAVPRDQGSWVSITVDERGRLITSAQSGGLYRLTPDASAPAPAPAVVEAIDLPVGNAQGLLCVDGDLYCVSNSGRADGAGLYRVRDTDGDDAYDEWKLLRALEGRGEHGPHGIVLGPDGLLYIVAGNHTNLPDPERSAVPRHWDEDHLLPRLWDASGHAVGIMAPGGWVCRTDRDGATWELYAVGFRNCYDIAFDPNGELFTFDADMEWDMGAPWYRPTRVSHVVSGAEFGWRSGSAKWPPYYPDSLPATIDIGPGSPTGIVFGTGAAFPKRYRDALFILDWTFGTIYAVHLEPSGASYDATTEVFLTGRPFPVADAVVNPADGAMYVVVGGRGVPSAVYRISWTGAAIADGGDNGQSDNASKATDARRARKTRRHLETLHHPDASADAVDDIWPHLASRDRFIRYAARIALEHQPVARWIDRLEGETDARVRLAALMAVARCGGPDDRAALVAGLESLVWRDLDRPTRLEMLRVWALCFIRLGPPDPAVGRRLARGLELIYPTNDDDLDREICDLLVYLDSPVVVSHTVPMMERMDAKPAPRADEELLSRSRTYGSVIQKMATAPPQRQQVHYALALRTATRGWTPQLRDRYFRWFDSARRTSGGVSFAGFLDSIRNEALDHAPEADRERLARLGTAADPLIVDVVPKGPGRQWTIDEIVKLAGAGLSGRDFENGRSMYAAASCASCHRFAGTGRMGGPDLTALATRYTVRDLAESMVEPSRTISDQYRQTEIVKDDDEVIIGRIVGTDDDGVRVQPTMLAPDWIVTVPVDRIRSRRPSEVSSMMPGLLDRLNRDEVLDLLAYLLAEGDPRNAMFRSE